MTPYSKSRLPDISSSATVVWCSFHIFHFSHCLTGSRLDRPLLEKAECRRIDAFELWCWRRLLRVPWTARRSNQSILNVLLGHLPSRLWVSWGQGICLILFVLPVLSNCMAQESFRKCEAIEETRMERGRNEGKKKWINLFHNDLLSAYNVHSTFRKLRSWHLVTSLHGK